MQFASAHKQTNVNNWEKQQSENIKLKAISFHII